MLGRRKQVPSASRELALYLSIEQECSYLPGQRSANLFVDPGYPVDADFYTRLIGAGFRRSGSYIYRPYCPNCEACVPIRIPVESFTMTRSQKRTWQKNRDLTVRQRPAACVAEHFDLYRRYQAFKHPESPMNDPDISRYASFLVSDAMQDNILFIEFRRGSRLVGVSVTDRLLDGLSAVYTFYDPGELQRSLGVYSILSQIEIARGAGLRWLYLGYWIKACAKMAYKSHFRPHEVLRDRIWAAGVGT